VIRKRCALALGLACSGAVALAAQPTFSTRVEGVRVDVLVTEGGRPVPDLGPADFDVRDNGVAQTIDLVSLRDVPVSVIMTLDLSASVVGSRLLALQRAGSALVDAMSPDDSAALIGFNRVVVQRVPLTRDLDAVRRALPATSAEGDTALIDAALAAMLLGEAEGGRTLVVLFSDGVDTASFSRPEVVVEAARRVNAVVYAVGTRADDSRFLRALTEATGGRIINLDSAADPGPAFLEILREFRRRYVITFMPTGVDREGWHQLSVRVNRRNARVQARPGYFSAQR
jgi:VWFA-related protein